MYQYIYVFIFLYVYVSLLGLEINFYKNKTKNVCLHCTTNMSIFLVKFKLLHSGVSR